MSVSVLKTESVVGKVFVVVTGLCVVQLGSSINWDIMVAFAPPPPPLFLSSRLVW